MNSVHASQQAGAQVKKPDFYWYIAYLLWFVSGYSCLLLLRFLGVFLFLLDIKKSIPYLFSKIFYGEFFVSFYEKVVSFCKREKQKEPKDIFLLKKEHDFLFLNFVEDVCGRLSAPPVHQVFIDGSFSARIETKGFRRKKATLFIGVYILCLLDVSQLKAVVAHEISHLKHKNRVHLFFYYSVLEREVLKFFEKIEFFRVAKFVNYCSYFFIKKLHAYFARMNRYLENLTDKRAIEVVGVYCFQEALLSSELRTAWFQKVFFQKILTMRKWQEKMPNYILIFARTVGKLSWQKIYKDFSEQIYSNVTLENDTHFSTIDRVRHFGEVPLVKNKIERSSLFFFFKDAALVNYFYQWIFTQNSALWQKNHQELRRLAFLRRQATLSFDKLKELATLIEIYEGKEKAEYFYRQAYEKNPADPNVNLFFAELAYANKNIRKALEHYAVTIENDPFLGNKIAAWLIPILKKNNVDSSTIDFFENKRKKCLIELESFSKERQAISLLDTYLPVDDKYLRDMVKQMIEAEFTSGLFFLVKKKLSFLPQYPMYVLAFVGTKSREAISKEWLQKIHAIDSNATFFILDYRYGSLALFKKIETVENAVVFSDNIYKLPALKRYHLTSKGRLFLSKMKYPLWFFIFMLFRTIVSSQSGSIQQAASDSSENQVSVAQNYEKSVSGNLSNETYAFFGSQDNSHVFDDLHRKLDVP